MRCILTRAIMDRADPEYATALRSLAQQSTAMRRYLTREAGTGTVDDPKAWSIDNWQYLASVPFREDDNTIRYVHVFRHMRLMHNDAPLATGIPASAAWWPVSCHSAAPQRTPSRARLKLVS
jgi:hypothetical protein